MKTTADQESKFYKHIIPHDLLEMAIEWIANNTEPEDVFSEEQLAAWATSNGFVEE